MFPSLSKAGRSEYSLFLLLPRLEEARSIEFSLLSPSFSKPDAHITAVVPLWALRVVFILCFPSRLANLSPRLLLSISRVLFRSFVSGSWRQPKAG